MRSFSLRFPGGKPKAMTFSYDDGLTSDLRLAEIMGKYGVKCTLNINTFPYANGGEQEDFLKLSELRELANNPLIEIACHGDIHPYYTYLPQSNATNDIMENRKMLEEITGKIIRGFAYPSISCFNDASEMALTASGIVYARLGGNSGSIELPENWLRWPATCHHKNALEFYKKFEALDNTLRHSTIMYVWGHSFEFDRENNWEIIEQLLECCHDNPDIWFATNMEIYNYANAFNSLVFSADGDKVYNPTAVDLWGVCNANKHTNSGKVIKIPTGETVSLLQ